MIKGGNGKHVAISWAAGVRALEECPVKLPKINKRDTIACYYSWTLRFYCLKKIYNTLSGESHEYINRTIGVNNRYIRKSRMAYLIRNAYLGEGHRLTVVSLIGLYTVAI
jgi:hypothetical protein